MYLYIFHINLFVLNQQQLLLQVTFNILLN